MAHHKRYKRIVVTAEMVEDSDYEQTRDHWLCDCGNYITDGCHCPKCGAEPPWVCPCGLCQDGDGRADFDDDYDDRDVCDRCGGNGFIEYDDAGPDVWGEDSPSEVNHLVDCPDCGGTGEYIL